MISIAKKIIVSIFIAFISFPALAAKKKNYNNHYDFTNSSKYAGLVVNADTGEIIYQRNADKVLHPASLTKMMTLYMTFKAIDEGTLTFDQQLPISAKAAAQPKTNLRLTAGSTISVKHAVLGLIVHSANDASVVLAEAIAGNQDAFADKMTNIAKSLGMKNTNFTNPHGLPDTEQVTSALDMAKLAIALRRDFSHHYHLFNTRSFKFNGSIINGHNRVMQRYPWADGLKTGFIHASGFNLVTSANKHNTRLIGVVMGGHTAHARDTHMIQLLEYGYESLQKKKSKQQPQIEVATAKNYNLGTTGNNAFEVAYNDSDELSEAETVSSNDDGQVIGDLAKKGLGSSKESGIKKLDVTPLKSPTKATNQKPKITVISSKKDSSAKMHNARKYQKVIVLKQKQKTNATQVNAKSKKARLTAQRKAKKITA